MKKALLEWGRFMLIALGVVAIFDWYVIPLLMGLPPMADWFLVWMQSLSGTQDSH
jgi:hypothetical protein